MEIDFFIFLYISSNDLYMEKESAEDNSSQLPNIQNTCFI